MVPSYGQLGAVTGGNTGRLMWCAHEWVCMARHNRPVAPDAEPGTGTQIATLASPPCGCPPDRQGEMDECDDYNHDHPNSMRINGRRWKVGHDYVDAELGDVCELVAIVGRSSWCDNRDPENCPPELVFEYERYRGGSGNTIRINPSRPDDEINERFVERWTRDPPLGAPNPPW